MINEKKKLDKSTKSMKELKNRATNITFDEFLNQRDFQAKRINTIIFHR